MRRKTFAHMNCSIARALEQIGEWWTFLIVREALMGTRRFDQFQSNLGIARNILAARLKKLVARGILERTLAPDNARRIEYRMTEKGRALFPVLMALREWGDRWVVGPDRVPVIVVDRTNAEPIEVRVTGRDGRPVGWLEAKMIPGPGAQAALKTRLTRAQSGQSRIIAATAYHYWRTAMETIRFDDVDKLRSKVSQEFSAWSKPIDVTQDKINQFADVTGDHQWIHVDIERAKRESPFKGPVAHGFLTLSLIPALEIPREWNVTSFRNVVNYGANKLRFISPVPAGAKVHARSRVVAVEPKPQGTQMTTETQVQVVGQDKPALIYEGIFLYVK